MHASSDCLLIQSQLQLHAGRDLSPEEDAVVERHLAHCGACAALAESARISRLRIVAAAVDVESVDAAVYAVLQQRAEALAEAPNLWQRLAPQLRSEGLIRSADAAPSELASSELTSSKSTRVESERVEPDVVELSVLESSSVEASALPPVIPAATRAEAGTTSREAAALASASRTSVHADRASSTPARGKLLSMRGSSLRRLAVIGGLAAALACAAWWVQRTPALSLGDGSSNADVADAHVPPALGSGAAIDGPAADAPNDLVASGTDAGVAAQGGVATQDGVNGAAAPVGASNGLVADERADASQGGLRRMRADERPFSDFAQDPAALRRLPFGRDALPSEGAATAASQRELR